ncbi:hypothetical protein LTR37_002433 [Vermiconidia calcicola]|uniref:Uncharacterized protein n=1 Tax=Vermiconidia calcicola TaxID=1690605 RepID=A0ACC3NSQ7_9PEZI|nr:hypothetical protein LTR37_002433 [Vermiconidia calcicola]
MSRKGKLYERVWVIDVVPDELHMALVRGQQWTLNSRRAYAVCTSGNAGQTSRQDRYETHLPLTRIGVVTTDSPKSTKIEQLLAELGADSSDPAEQALERSDNPTFLGLFVTPAFAQHVLDPELPLRVFERIKGNRKHKKTLKTVTAVVDRLPTLERSQGRKGREGIAYAFARELSPKQDAQLVSQPLSHEETKPGTVSFVIPPSSRYMPEMKAQLPLAQTTFSTGRVSTLFAATYTPGPVSNSPTGDEELGLDGEQQALHSTTLPVIACGQGGPDYLGTFFPLIPLTEPRRVERCMGNIVRALSTQTFQDEQSPSGDSPVTATTQPASQELESTISAFFESNNVAPQAVQVWALIIPAHVFSILKSRELYNHVISNLLRRKPHAQHPIDVKVGIRNLIARQGGRLCKVLSGGGGWGKKAGLLSLDPEVEYSTSDWPDRGDSESLMNAAEEDFADITMREQQKRALGEIVKEGESLMFFLAPPSDAPAGIVPDADYTPLLSRLQQGALFGCLPSSVDDETLPSELGMSGSATGESSPHIQHFPNIFGFLSEGGMALIVSSTPGVEALANRSKSDVPYSSWVFGQSTEEALAKKLKSTKLNDAKKTVEQLTGKKMRGFGLRRKRDAGFDEVAQAQRRNDEGGARTESFFEQFGDERDGEPDSEMEAFLRKNTRTLGAAQGLQEPQDPGKHTLIQRHQARSFIRKVASPGREGPFGSQSLHTLNSRRAPDSFVAEDGSLSGTHACAEGSAQERQGSSIVRDHGAKEQNSGSEVD